jgi:type II secretory pathway pseudopilin PulG
LNIKESFQFQKKGVAAFTLVEVIMSSAIFGLIFASVATALAQGYTIIENARDNAHINQILQSEVENVRSMNWDDLNAMPDWERIQQQAGFATSISDRFVCERFINERRVGQKEIILTITWTDRRQTNHFRKFVTYYTKEGMYDYQY